MSAVQTGKQWRSPHLVCCFFLLAEGFMQLKDLILKKYPVFFLKCELSFHSVQWCTIRLTSAWQIPFIPLCSPSIQLCWMEKKHLVSLKHLPPFFPSQVSFHIPCFSSCLVLHLPPSPPPPSATALGQIWSLHPSRTRWQLFIIIFGSISHGL